MLTVPGDGVHHGEEDLAGGREGTAAGAGGWLLTLSPLSGRKQ